MTTERSCSAPPRVAWVLVVAGLAELKQRLRDYAKTPRASTR